MTQTTPMQQFNAHLAGVQDLLARTTPGPWFWWGNTDQHQIMLAGRGPYGVTGVVTTVGVDRDAGGRDAAGIRSGMRDCGYDQAAIDTYVHDWAFDEDRTPRQDERLALANADGWLKTVEELAVYEVAVKQGLPNGTPRDHPKVYRADICGVRDNPNGEFLAGSWSLVEELSRTLARVAALVVEQPTARLDENGDFCGLVSGRAEGHRTLGTRAISDGYGCCSPTSPCADCWPGVDMAALIEALTGQESQ